MKPTIPAQQAAERRLRARALLAHRVEGDYLVLGDATLIAALDGSRPLGPVQATALMASPLTLRRFRTLAETRRRQAGASWTASAGMLRAADDGAALAALQTDDGYWALHFLRTAGLWQVVLKLDADAPFAASVLQGGALLQVVDGTGAVVLQGSLDRDGECEQAWPFAEAPAAHFQRHGARFGVALVGATDGTP